MDTLDTLYRRHAPSVFRRARRLLGNDADAEEIVQEVFLSLSERPEQYAALSAMTTFLYSMTTHACLNRIRNRKNRARLLQRGLPAPASEPHDPLPTPEELALLHGMLRRMPDALAQVAVYAWVDELTHDDIARLLGCSRRQVGNLLERVAAWGRAQEKTPC